MRRIQAWAGVACVGAAMLAWAALSLSWFTADSFVGIAQVRVGLRAIEICIVGECHTAPLSQLLGKTGLLFRFFAWSTVALALLTAALVAAGAARRVLQDEGRVLLRWAVRAAGLAGSGTLLSFFTFPGRGVEVGPSFWLSLLGVGLVVVGGFSALQTSEGWGNQVLPVRGPVAPVLPGARAPSQPGASATPAPPPSPGPGAAPAAAPVAVSAADRRRRETELREGTLKYVARQVEILATQVRATSEGGSLRELAWADVAAVIATQLPADAPQGRMVFVDVVPRGGGPPVRVTPATRANYAALPGAGSTSTENFRRLVAYAQAHAPGAAFDGETAAFASGRAPMAFVSLSAFAAYDARYG